MNQFDNANKFWDGVRGQQKLNDAAAEATRQEHYEETIVKRLLQQAKVPLPGWGVIANQCRERTGLDYINFEWFREQYPRFPVRLLPQKVPRAHKTQLIDLFKRFSRTTVFETFRELAEYHGVSPREQAVGLVFEMGSLGTCVLHTYPRYDQMALDGDASDEGTRIVRPMGSPPTVYVVEQVPTILKAIGTGWVDG